MKRYLPFLMVAVFIGSVPVFAQLTLPKQAQKTIPNAPRLEIVNPTWTAFEYQVFEIKDPRPGGTGIGLGAGTPTLDPEGRIVFGPAPTPIEIGNVQFQALCNDMGKKGWELIQLSPRVEEGTTKSYRAVFKRESKQTTIRTTR